MVFESKNNLVLCWFINLLQPRHSLTIQLGEALFNPFIQVSEFLRTIFLHYSSVPSQLGCLKVFHGLVSGHDPEGPHSAVGVCGPTYSNKLLLSSIARNNGRRRIGFANQRRAIWAGLGVQAAPRAARVAAILAP